MNLYHLFTADSREWWVRSPSSELAIKKVEHEAKSSVSCWFLGHIPKRGTTVLNFDIYDYDPTPSAEELVRFDAADRRGAFAGGST